MKGGHGQTNRLHDINWGALDYASHVQYIPQLVSFTGNYYNISRAPCELVVYCTLSVCLCTICPCYFHVHVLLHACTCTCSGEGFLKSALQWSQCAQFPLIHEIHSNSIIHNFTLIFQPLPHWLKEAGENLGATDIHVSNTVQEHATSLLPGYNHAECKCTCICSINKIKTVCFVPLGIGGYRPGHTRAKHRQRLGHAH